jgi:hypothetical protein
MNRMKALSLLAVVAAFAALSTALPGCYRQSKVEVSGPFPAERLIQLDEPGPSGDQTDLVVRVRVEKRLSPLWEERSHRITIVVDGLSLVERIKGIPGAEPGENGDVVLYELQTRLRLKPGVNDVSMKTEDTDFLSVMVELRGGKVHELVYEPVFKPHRHIRKRAMRLLNRESKFPRKLVGFKAYLDGKVAPSQ